MPYYIAGEFPRLEQLMIVTPEEFKRDRGIDVHINHRVEAIDPAGKTVTVRDLATDKTRTAGYDELVIATGAEPIVPKGVEAGLDGVYVLQELEDARAIKERVKRIRAQGVDSGLIVGAGYIGLEMAEGLTKAGVKVTMIVRGDRVMSRLHPEISADILEHLKEKGVEVITGVEVSQMRQAAPDRLKVGLTDGSSREYGLVLVAVGVRPRSKLAAEAGLELGRAGAIKVDRQGRTSAPHIWAGGDCAEAWHRLTQANAWVPLALTANKMGRVIADGLTGIPAAFPGLLGTSVTKVFDLAVGRTGLGLAELKDKGIEVETIKVTANSRPEYYPGSAPVKTLIHVDKKDGRPWGVEMSGKDGVAQRLDTWVAALSAGMSLEEVADLDLAYAPPFSTTTGVVAISAEVAAKKAKKFK